MGELVGVGSVWARPRAPWGTGGGRLFLVPLPCIAHSCLRRDAVGFLDDGGVFVRWPDTGKSTRDFWQKL